MKTRIASLVLVFACGLAYAQQSAKPYDVTAPSYLPSPANNQGKNTSPNLLNTAPSTPVLPPGTQDRFNEGLFTAKEQVHDAQILDLTGRVSSLEGKSYWISGFVWALGFLIIFFVGFLKLFWRGIVKVILAEHS